MMGMYCSVVIVAAGKGTRMGMDINKQYLNLKGKEVVAHTISSFEECDDIDEIIVVTGENEKEYFKENVWERYGFKKIKSIAIGGKERQDSVYNGLSMVSRWSDVVLIHDGARPLIAKKQIKESIKIATEIGACVVGVPVKDTIKVCDEKQSVIGTPARDTLWIVQTPQAFRYDWIMKAYANAKEKGVQGTDDAMLVEELGYPLQMIKGSYGNIKITTPEDLLIAEVLMK